MEYRTIEWDRAKLYDEIWNTPLRTVAKLYGLSDVGLAKICKKLQIPRPGVGYWRRKECGFKVVRLPDRARGFRSVRETASTERIRDTLSSTGQHRRQRPSIPVSAPCFQRVTAGWRRCFQAVGTSEHYPAASASSPPSKSPAPCSTRGTHRREPSPARGRRAPSAR